jgi:hypothetical protein
MPTMSDRRFVYIDGESHYIRSENAWRQLHGKEACLERLRYVNQSDDRMVLVLPEAKVFWTRRMNPNVLRASYFTSASGDEPAIHKLRVALRDFGLEPSIVKETKELRSQGCRDRHRDIPGGSAIRRGRVEVASRLAVLSALDVTPSTAVTSPGVAACVAGPA